MVSRSQNYFLTLLQVNRVKICWKAKRSRSLKGDQAALLFYISQHITLSCCSFLDICSAVHFITIGSTVVYLLTAYFYFIIFF